VKRKKTKKRNLIADSLKVAKRNARNEEIALHGKSINYKRIVASKKVYNRKKIKRKNRFENNFKDWNEKN
jgi:hypothetical protein